MGNIGKYNNPAAGGTANRVENDTNLLQNSPDTLFYQDSSAVPIDSSLLTPSDSTFRFWLIKPEEKLFIGDARVQPDTTYAEHIVWKGLKMVAHEKTYPDNDWLTIIMLLALLLLASVRIGYSKYIGALFHSLINYSTAYRMFREKNYTILHGAYRLEALFYILFSIFIFQIILMEVSKPEIFNWLVYAKTFGTVIIYFLLKKLAYRGFGSIFISASDTSEFLFNMDNFNRGAGIILFPIVAIITFYPFENALFPIVAGVFIFGGFYVMMLKRGISILLKKQFPIFYLFLYLCTLEILPLLLIYKIVAE